MKYYKIVFTYCEWGDTLGWEVIDEEMYKDLCEMAQEHSKKCFAFSYCADGDDEYIDVYLTGEQIYKWILANPVEIPEADYKVLKRYDCLGETSRLSAAILCDALNGAEYADADADADEYNS